MITRNKSITKHSSKCPINVSNISVCLYLHLIFSFFHFNVQKFEVVSLLNGQYVQWNLYFMGTLLTVTCLRRSVNLLSNLLFLQLSVKEVSLRKWPLTSHLLVREKSNYKPSALSLCKLDSVSQKWLTSLSCILLNTTLLFMLVYCLDYFPRRWHFSVRESESESDVNKKIQFVLWYIYTEHMQKSDIHI